MQPALRAERALACGCSPQRSRDLCEPASVAAGFSATDVAFVGGGGSVVRVVVVGLSPAAGSTRAVINAARKSNARRAESSTGFIGNSA